MKFIAHYADRQIEGNELGGEDSGWSSLPKDEPMTGLEYVISQGNSVRLEECEEYIHMIEALQQMGKQAVIESVYIMGRTNGKSSIYMIKLPGGEVSFSEVREGHEYRGGPVQGWRKGKGWNIHILS